jgi:molecular chaperone DnaK
MTQDTKNEKKTSSKVLGIDLGTTNSCMAILEGGEPTVVPNAEGDRTTPSIVAFSKTGERLVGKAAKRQAVTNPQNTIFSVKRLIGKKYAEARALQSKLPYKIVEGKNGDAYVECEFNGKREQFSPEQVSSFILAKLKSDAEAYLGEPISKAVITVPAYFNDAQRQATKDAGRIAGLDVLRIINEPTAASLAYGLDKKKDEKIAVYDLGGGTFDISVLEIGDGVFEVMATNGDNNLGGDDWDEAIIDFLVESFKKESGINLRNDPMALQRLKEEGERAKIALSSSQETDINLPFITADASGPKHLSMKLSRSKLEQICDGLYKRTIEPVNSCMKDAGLNASQIDELVLVGGMTRSPKVIDIARQIAGKEPHKGVNPDEVVAIGAAVQGGVLQGEVRDILLLDVTPLTLGIETAGGVCTPMIERNTTIPSKKTQVFSTYGDNQSAVDVKIFQGERPLAIHNKLLGNFRLDGIPPAPRGLPQIEVTFDIDANGILNVSAKDLGTNKVQHITISNSSGLDEAEIERLRKEAELHAEEDRKQKGKIEAHNQLDSLVYQTEKQLTELADKVSETRKTEIQGHIDEAKKVLEKTDASEEDLKAINEKLLSSLQAMSQELYANAGAKGSDVENPQKEATPPQNGTSSKKDDIIDADFKVVDDAKDK